MEILIGRTAMFFLPVGNLKLELHLVPSSLQRFAVYRLGEPCVFSNLRMRDCLSGDLNDTHDWGDVNF
jgi:hypothetical protein